MKSQSELEVIILAAGKGTRMKSELPKVLHTLCGVSLLERTLRAVVPLKPAKTVVVLGHGAELAEALLEQIEREHPGFIIWETVRQEEQKGTGHAAQVGMSRVSASAKQVLILPGDSPLITSDELAPLFSEGSKDAALRLLTAHPESPAGLGRIVRDSSGKLQGIVEERDATPEQRVIGEINASIYLAERAFLVEALGALGNDNAQNEYYLTDIVAYAVQKGLAVEGLPAENDSAVLGANSRYELSLLESVRRGQINRRWMESGVTIEDPQAVYIDEDVVMGVDCYLGAGTRLKGRTRLADRVTIEGDSIIRDCSIGEGVLVRLGCYFQDAVIGDRSSIGPFAQLRPGSVLETEVRIGNFVEVKNSRLAAGVKANHLTYLGDAEVGTESNIGAGTITCNYDGTSKHRTVIGSSCFIGSNSALVAPVQVADGAYVAAGSTISKNVPQGALGIARGQQRNIEGWVGRKRQTSDKK